MFPEQVAVVHCNARRLINKLSGHVCHGYAMQVALLASGLVTAKFLEGYDYSMQAEDMACEYLQGFLESNEFNSRDVEQQDFFASYEEALESIRGKIEAQYLSISAEDVSREEHVPRVYMGLLTALNKASKLMK